MSALQKQSVSINFAQGLDTKTDPKQVPIGKFLALENTVFSKGGLLQKRNGFASLTPLPDATSTYITTFNGDLTAVGQSLQAYSSASASWVNKGNIQSSQLSTLSLIRSNTNQTQGDVSIASNGLVCTVFTDQLPDGSGGQTASYKYAVADSTTGQNIIAPTVITGTSGSVTNAPRVFMLGRYFMIVFTVVISGTSHLQYLAVNTVIPTQTPIHGDITAQYTPSTTLAFDGVVANNSLYLAWNGSDGGGAIRVASISSTLVQSSTKVVTGHSATIVSVTADTSPTTPVIYVSFYSSGTSNGYTFAVSSSLVTIHASTQIISSESVNNLTAVATHGVCTFFYEVDNTYDYDSSIHTNLIKKNTITQAGSVGSSSVVVRSVGLASKAFIVGTKFYFLSIYNSTFQPTYFLIDESGNVVSKLAYSNGGSYYVTGLPNANVDGLEVKIPYLFKDLIQAANKSQGVTNAAGIYSQTGLNLATFTLGTSKISSAEIATNLHLSGGLLMMYDGYTPVEHGFNLWPDDVETTPAQTGGSMATQNYFYQVTYEWSDNQGNIFRSAPSLPVAVASSDLSGSSNSVTIDIPTLRLTYKTANPVKIVIYRWSAAQQTYYQVTSITSPLLNDTTVDSVEFVDTLADSSILGNNIIYTTGGVLENIGAPASNVVTLFNNRLFLIDAEDNNLLWFSKQVIESVPVEMTDLLTIYVAPTTSAQGSTGPTKAAAALDDKLILFKKDAIYYISGVGPDNTGANSQYSDAVFITSTVGCENQQSIIFVPQGLMFESDKGIWLLGRDLSTSYIGAAVEGFTENASVLSAVNVPGTNQVRFTLDSGITLMYDYYYGQWGAFTKVPAISSTLYQGKHTFINSSGQLFQEQEGTYLDGSSPVLMRFTTSWVNLGGLQGFQRAYFFYLLGTYLTPHKLQVDIAFDYTTSPTQSVTISPENFSAPYGGETVWGGGSAWGGPSNIEQWRVFLNQQQCQSFQITLTEQYDPSFGVAAGAGLTLSGLDLIIGVKSSYPRIKSALSTG